MPGGLRHNIPEVRDELKRIEQELPSMLMEVARFANQRITARSRSKYMRDAKGEGYRKRSDTGPLRVVTGRLVRSVRVAFDQADGGTREGFVDVEVEGGRLTMRKGSRVPYAAMHEEGGTFSVPAHMRHQASDDVVADTRTSVTKKGRTKTWAKYLSQGMVPVRAHSMTVPARPYLAPALDDTAPAIQRHAAERLVDLMHGRAS